MADPERRSPMRRRFDIETLNQLVQILALVGAGIWGVYTFIYQAEIVPSLAPPTLSVATSISKTGEKGNLVAVRATVTRSNVGQTRVRLLAITYNVTGIKEHFGTADETNPEFDQAIGQSNPVRVARYYGKPERSDVIYRTGSLFAGATDLPATASDLYPGEALARDVLFYVDKSLYDSVRMEVRLHYTRMSDPPIPLSFAVDANGLLIARPVPSCDPAGARCRGLNTTDFSTDLSLW